ncbi:YceI family protein [Cognatiyoonia sp. IB215446]|uniref:YceI family protein n=1 Tax=Cognatiyoonia sp. IB215446 TaxID=3097355 RepID=UPI002A0C49E3|nr:YceI family protein [Cognatiyoonia sp. IB215446]MDX8347110.1 YceI family protein [Cognatiyoonia sp. IB215446]
MRNFKLPAAAIVIGLGTAAFADGHAGGWVLNGEQSVVSFGSIKNDDTGEAHTFSGLTGSVSPDGMASVEIDLNSLETNIDIRNERMIEHVFKNAPSATLKAQVDMADFDGLAVGESTVTEIDGDVVFLGVEAPVYMDVFVMRLDAENVIVTTQSMMFISTDELEINEGIDMLQELASLDSITRTAPVSFRLMFSAGATQS